ncbi:MAG: Uma2 family endonuclease, partial [Desulfobacterales bacterium]|nr:Uma2 family endonuclease [Desulfobacterales bacterium]
MKALHTLSRNDPIHRETYTVRADRPGWIPPDILYDWDTDPYAYQTEEELMPAGGPHGELLTYITEILRDFLKRKGMRYLADTFMLYRDTRGIRQRVAPDLLVMPFCSPAPSAYDLDTGQPPYAVAEITSPESRSGDMDDKVSLYTGLGIPAYLVIDMFTSRKKFRRQIGLHLWRITEGRVCKVKADADGYLPVPEMGVKTKAQGQNLVFADIVTGEILCDTGQLRQKLEQEAAQAKKEKQRAEKEKQRA